MVFFGKPVFFLPFGPFNFFPKFLVLFSKKRLLVAKLVSKRANGWMRVGGQTGGIFIKNLLLDPPRKIKPKFEDYLLFGFLENG